MHKTQAALYNLAVRCNEALRDYLDHINPLFDLGCHPDPITQFVIPQLAVSCHATSESALVLVGNVRLWDADMLVRWVFEGTLKFAFLCEGSSAERSAKAKEYWDDLPAISRLKRHHRVKQMLAALENPDADEWRPYRELLLPLAEVTELERVYPKQVRKPLEQKWAFFEIAQAIDQKNGFVGGCLKHLMYGYGMASHQIHQDGDGIALIWDRARREPDRFDAIELAHGSRILSDLLAMGMMRAYMLCVAVVAEKRLIAEIDRAHEGFRNELRVANQEWHRVEYGNEVA